MLNFSVFCFCYFFFAVHYVWEGSSATHYGACLSQKGSDNIERPCAYASKLLSEKEAKQAPGFWERVSLAFALRLFNPYLVGKEFLIRTDHKPNLSLIKGKTKVYDTLTDEILSYLPFRMEYLNGSKMFADILSRPLGTSPDINTVSISPSPDQIPNILKPMIMPVIGPWNTLLIFFDLLIHGQLWNKTRTPT